MLGQGLIKSYKLPQTLYTNTVHEAHTQKDEIITNLTDAAVDWALTEIQVKCLTEFW